MKTCIYCICMLLLTACNSGKDNAARNKDAVVKAHEQMIRNGNVNYADELFVNPDHAKTVKELISGMKTTLPDYQYTLDFRNADNNTVTWIRTATATHAGDIGGRKASGKPVKWDEVVVSKFDDNGKITDEWWMSNFDAKSRESMNIEGTYEYLPPLKGQAIVQNGTFLFLSGASDGKGGMNAEGGSYSLSGDKVMNKITYSTNPKRIGVNYTWKMKSWAGDTATFVILNDKDEETATGRSVRISK